MWRRVSEGVMFATNIQDIINDKVNVVDNAREQIKQQLIRRADLADNQLEQAVLSLVGGDADALASALAAIKQDRANFGEMGKIVKSILERHGLTLLCAPTRSTAVGWSLMETVLLKDGKEVFRIS